ncbi:MAG: response regulator, partial [Nitrospirota bacterium]|nr:response regulator [Nitrospirota bacterium]
MKTPLRLLHLEDDPVDAELITTTLIEGDIPCQSQLVDTRQAFVAALKEGRMDLILADYSIPGFDGMT